MPEISPDKVDVIVYALQAAALFAIVPTMLVCLWLGYALVKR